MKAKPQKLKQQMEALIDRYPGRRSALLPVMDLLQRSNDGSLTSDEIRTAAEVIGIPVSEAFGVASYYTLYNTKPVGRYHLQVDTGVPGFLSGACELLEHLASTLGIRAGETTPDGLFTLSEVQDLASCGTAPVIQVNDTYYENLTKKKVDELIASLRAGSMPLPDQKAHFSSACQILLKNRENPKAVELSVAKKQGGYAALQKALQMKPAEIVGLVKESMLRGRGGAGFSTGTKWGFLPKGDPRPVYLICNADEGEPGTFKDRQILQHDPHLLIEGLGIAAHAVQARKAFIYIRGEFRWIAGILEKAIDAARSDGLLKHVDIVVHRGEGSYVCGDETALIESLEGKRGNPRVKPPFPANVGLYGCPTIVNNVETLSCLPFIVEKGAEAFKAIGSPGNAGPKLYGVCGHVKKPGMFEFPMGTPLTTILDAAGGVKGRLKAVVVGGLSVPILTAAESKGLVMDFDGCLKAGTMMGSGGIIVMNDTISTPELALRTIRFYAHESCGQCIPCWSGSQTIKSLLQRIVAGQGTLADIDAIMGLCTTIKGSTICPTGDAFAIPIEAMIRKFRGEFETLVQHREGGEAHG
jgi:NADH:ubiquinone oxidoreductase subunit F (NADH-binding)/NADH:ubiquinone oxidoreductase subunit E